MDYMQCENKSEIITNIDTDADYNTSIWSKSLVIRGLFEFHLEDNIVNLKGELCFKQGNLHQHA